jgi:hypothetical protein
MLLIIIGWLFCGLCFWYALAVLHQRTTDRREQQTAEMQARVEARDAATESEKQLAGEAKKRQQLGQQKIAAPADKDQAPTRRLRWSGPIFP